MTFTIEPWGEMFELQPGEELALEMQIEDLKLPFWEILYHEEGLSLYVNGDSPAFRLMKDKGELSRFE